jgi:uncharacterized membrane protein YdbT with pleckstrin-like domain
VPAGTVAAVKNTPQNYHLTADERLVIDLRPHWIQLVPSAARALLALAVWGFLSARTGGLIGKAVDAAFGALSLWFNVLFLYRVLTWWFTHFAVTSERIIVRSGVLARKGIEIPLDRINTVFFEQSILERLLKAGDIAIESASEQGRQNFLDVKNPQRVQQVIYQAREAARDDLERRNSRLQGEAIAQALRSDTTAELEKLAKMRQNQEITEAEYETLKNRLLG